MLVHIWKSLPFWTLILIAGRLAIPAEHYEAASVDGATRWQKFRYITWPSMRTLYLTCTILSMIWTLGDFNSVYLLTGGGPADLTHVLATLGIRYLRLDLVDLSMAAIVVALPAVLPLVYFMMKRLSEMTTSWRKVTTEAKLLLIGIPVLIWTMLPIYHLFLFAISPKESALGGQLWPDHPTLQNFRIVFQEQHHYLEHFWLQMWNSLIIAVAVGRADAGGRHRCRVRDQPPQGARRPH